MTAAQSSRCVGLSLAAFWRAVRDGRLPAPVYPAPRAPRWFLAELHAAVRRLRQLPSEAVAARHTIRLEARAVPAVAIQGAALSRATRTRRAPSSTGDDR